MKSNPAFVARPLSCSTFPSLRYNSDHMNAPKEKRFQFSLKVLILGNLAIAAVLAGLWFGYFQEYVAIRAIRNAGGDVYLWPSQSTTAASLYIRNPQFNDDNCEGIRHLKHLSTLQIQDAQITDRGLSQIALLRDMVSLEL